MQQTDLKKIFTMISGILLAGVGICITCFSLDYLIQFFLKTITYGTFYRIWEDFAIGLCGLQLGALCIIFGFLSIKRPNFLIILLILDCICAIFCILCGMITISFELFGYYYYNMIERYLFPFDVILPLNVITLLFTIITLKIKDKSSKNKKAVIVPTCETLEKNNINDL